MSNRRSRRQRRSMPNQTPKQTPRKQQTRRIPPQLTLDFKEGKRRADAGMAAALSSNVAVPWADQCERWLAERDSPFTADALVLSVGLPSGDVGINENNAVGALIRKWSQRGSIKRTGYTTAKRPESHGRLVAVWTPSRLV